MCFCFVLSNLHCFYRYDITAFDKFLYCLHWCRLHSSGDIPLRNLSGDIPLRNLSGDKYLSGDIPLKNMVFQKK